MSLQDIIKTDNIIRISPNENLSSALSKLSTSHDAGFLFNDDEKLIGLINPYYSLIKSSFPGNAKVEHCMYHQPKIYADYSISKVADLFIQSKVHYLPVFNRQDKFLGIISARHLLGQFRNLPIFNIKIKELLKSKNKPLSVILEDDTVIRAVNIFKLTKHSKLIVVNKDQKLKGILTYYDLISYLVSPKAVEKRGEREGNKINFYHHKVINFAKPLVLTLTPENSLNDVIRLILDKKIGSVVVIDEKRHPIGIITTKDLLRFFMRENHEMPIEVISKNLSMQSRHIFGGFFARLTHMFRKTQDLHKARVFVKEERGKNLFKVVLALFPKRGKPEVISREGKNLINVLNPVHNALRRLKRK